VRASGTETGGLTAALARTIPPVLGALELVVLLLIAFANPEASGRGFDFRAYWDAGARIAAGSSLYDPATVAALGATLLAPRPRSSDVERRTPTAGVPAT
jgi:hypothetical protein